jgi:hypothetical protein
MPTSETSRTAHPRFTLFRLGVLYALYGKNLSRFYRATELDLWPFSGKLRGSVFNPLFKLNWLNQLNGWDPSGRVSRLTHLARLTLNDLGIY